MTTERARWARRGGLALLFVAPPALAWLLFTSSGNDDTHITFWAARSLARTGRILNYDGERVEQSSSLTLVVVLALLAKLLPISIPTLGVLTSLAANGATAVVTFVLGRATAPRLHRWLVPAIATSTCFAYWSASGMESSLAALTSMLVILSFARAVDTWSVRRALLAFASALAFAAVRPESLVVLVAAAAALLVADALRGSTPRRRALALFAIAALAVALLSLFRRLYFKAWLPNPALVKAGGFDLDKGAGYLYANLFSTNALLVFLVPLGLVVVLHRIFVRRSASNVVVLAAAITFAQLAFILSSGGDWMPAGRFLVPTVPAAILVAALPLEWIEQKRRFSGHFVFSVVVALNLFLSSRFEAGSTNVGRPAWTLPGLASKLEARIGPNDFGFAELGARGHLRDTVVVAELTAIVDRLDPSADRPLFVMSGQAGMVPYYLFSKFGDRLRFLDQFSLTETRLLRCIPPEQVTRNEHGALVPLEVVFKNGKRLGGCGLRAPDLVFSSALSGNTERVLEANGYELVYLQTGQIQVGGGKHASSNAGAFIAVKKSLAGAAGLVPKSWVWSVE